MFKRFRRALLGVGLNPVTALVLHFAENVFIFALIVWKILFWDYGTLDLSFFLFSGPILCFLFVAIVEAKTLFQWNKLSKENRNKNDSLRSISLDGGMASSWEKENGQTPLTVVVHDDDTTSLSLNVDKDSHKTCTVHKTSIMSRLQFINECFFDVTATLIVSNGLVIYMLFDHFSLSSSMNKHNILGFATLFFSEILEWCFITVTIVEIMGSIGETNPATVLGLVVYAFVVYAGNKSRGTLLFQFLAVFILPMIIFYFSDRRQHFSLSICKGFFSGHMGMFIFPFTFMCQLVTIFIYPLLALIVLLFIRILNPRRQNSKDWIDQGSNRKIVSILLLPLEKNPATLYTHMIVKQGNHWLIDYLYEKLCRSIQRSSVIANKAMTSKTNDEDEQDHSSCFNESFHVENEVDNLDNLAEEKEVSSSSHTEVKISEDKRENKSKANDDEEEQEQEKRNSAEVSEESIEHKSSQDIVKEQRGEQKEEEEEEEEEEGKTEGSNPLTRQSTLNTSTETDLFEASVDWSVSNPATKNQYVRE